MFCGLGGRGIRVVRQLGRVSMHWRDKWRGHAARPRLDSCWTGCQRSIRRWLTQVGNGVGEERKGGGGGMVVRVNIWRVGSGGRPGGGEVDR